MASNLLNRLFHIVQQAVFPSKCLVCDVFFHVRNRHPNWPHSIADQRAWPLSIRAQVQISLATCLCPNCISDLIPVESPFCTVCGIPFTGRQGQDHYCGGCTASVNKFGMARAPLVYDRIITKVIHCFKYRGKIQLARPLGEILLTAFGFFWEKDSIDIILPVALHPRRFRQRGFNQAHLLVRNWPEMAASGFCDFSPFRIACDVLIRKFPTAPQTALGRAQRAANIKNAFDLKHPETIAGKRVLLVDDVFTTGATVNECGRLLFSRGAHQVDVLTLARAL